MTVESGQAESRGLEEIIGISRYYGRDSEWVIAGGGNASWKNRETLWVKASGTSLAGASRATFVELDREKLAPMWNKEYSRKTDEREREALADLMAAREAGQTLRPSVETGMHDVLPQAFVLHTHPTVINAVTCSANGEAVMREIAGGIPLLGDGIIWIPSINPGWVLSKRIFDEVKVYRDQHKDNPQVVVLQNHGITVASEDVGDIHLMHRKLGEALLQKMSRVPDMGIAETDLTVAAEAAGAIRHAAGDGVVVLFEAPGEVLKRASAAETMAPLMRPFSPDHIVYAGHKPLYLESVRDIGDRYREYVQAEKTAPKIVVLKDVGFFAVGGNPKVAESARMLFRDALKITRYAENFGGPQGMPDAEIDFIRNWEVEQFRAEVSLKD